LKVIRFLKRVDFGATPRQKQAQTLPLASEVRPAKRTIAVHYRDPLQEPSAPPRVERMARFLLRERLFARQRAQVRTK
jgi:hypothetical protein